MITFSDIRTLPPTYLRQRLKYSEHGLSAEDLGHALTVADADTRAYLLANVPGLETASSPDPARAMAVQRQLVALYFWEIVYWGFPEVYQAFSRLQRFPFEELFPAARFAGRDVLEVGCGSGKLTRHLARSTGVLTAVDPAPGLLVLAAKDGPWPTGVRFQEGSFDALPLGEASVDAVVSNLAFQATEERGGRRGLREMRRVLRPGGLIALVVGSEGARELLIAEGFAPRVAQERPRMDVPSGEDRRPLLTMLRHLGQPAFLGDPPPAGEVLEWEDR